MGQFEKLRMHELSSVERNDAARAPAKGAPRESSCSRGRLRSVAAIITVAVDTEGSIIRLIGAVLLEQNDEYQLQCRYMQLEGMTTLATPQIGEIAQLQITPKAA